MSCDYLIGIIVAFGLLMYLAYVLARPERF
ncbi:MAG TPA: K(+)-transporting ATPase subunit F [Phycisphaerae bacterium]|nr:K(+)-transporting ATPase subunit F [Phycisphaerae bacterium]